MDRFDKCGHKRLEVKRLIIILILTLTLAFLIMNIINSFAINMPSVKAENGSSACVMDVASGKVLYGQNIHTRLPMASTTKIATAIVAIENADLDKIITVPDEAVGTEGSSIYLKKGEKLSVRELLYGLMLRSGNDSAIAIAYAVKGNVGEFVKLMNDKCKELNLKNTHFMNPHGLHDDNHYTSAYDLAVISAYAMKNPIFKEIVSTKSKIIGDDSRENKRYLVNKNKLLHMYEGANGLKTGYTTKAGRCLVGSAERNGMQLVSVVLNHYSMWEDTMTYLDNAFNKYCSLEILRSNKEIAKIRFKGKDIAICCHENFRYPVQRGDENKLNYTIDIDNNKKEAVKGGEIGIIRVYYDKHLIFETKIYTM